ncbi:MAG TPA: TonB-dependent receptor [Candidatus Baltobacteraceae bacterium]|jgi:outer membrane receptor protein involved in Fe transport
MRHYVAALLAAFFCFSGLPALAATTGLVRGTILVNNAPTAGVQVTLEAEGTLLRTMTDASGAFGFPQVPFGRYTLVAHHSGVADQTVSVDVSSDAIVTIDLSLGQLKIIGGSGITSHAGASGNPVSVNTIGRQQLAALPTNNSLDAVVQTVPGIVKFSYGEPVAHGFHGLSYEIDGAPIPQATSSNFAELIDPKNIDSVEVLTGAFPAEYGGSREGAVVNIVTNRTTDLAQPFEGSITGGFGNLGQALASFNAAAKVGKSEVFLNANSQHTHRGLDAPTYDPIHDDGSQSDQFLRTITPIGQRDSIAFDYSNQLAQFAIPINTDPNNPVDPIVSVPGTDDVQREYDRYANLNFTAVSKDGNGVFQFIPWYRSTRIAYDGDLAKDVRATQPDPATGSPTPLVGLRQDRSAKYVGVRLSDFRATAHHAFKVGLDFSREDFRAFETFAQLGQPNVDTSVAQPGTQIGLYAQDKWSPSKVVSVDYGLRYDHSTGFVGGRQLSPRIGVNIAPDGRNVVHFYYGRFYAAPQLEDVRQACVALQGCPSVPVYDLKPETDGYFEMGVSHTFSPAMSGYVNYFRRTASNVLDTTQLLNTPLFAVFNNAIGRDEGVELRLQGNRTGGDSWFVSGTVSHAEAGDISGSTFLFGPQLVQPAHFSAADLQPEDHDQTYEANSAYTHRWGTQRSWFATLQGEYGTGYPQSFESGVDRLPAHFTLDLGLGKEAGKNGTRSLGFDLDITNLLNHQYVIKIANGFNTTQIASRRNILLRVTAPF